MKKKTNNKTKIYKTRRKHSNINVTKLSLTIAILILLCLNLYLVIQKILVPKSKEQLESKQNQVQQNEIETNESDKISSEQNQLEFLKKGTERDRIEYYCGQFFKNIENKNYEKAYQVLYPEFKQQYFPTIEDFKKYVQKTYPSVLAINYDDFDRQGDIYITTVLVDNALAKDNSKQFSQRIVVQESDYNKYVLSFQVI